MFTSVTLIGIICTEKCISDNVFAFVTLTLFCLTVIGIKIYFRWVPVMNEESNGRLQEYLLDNGIEEAWLGLIQSMGGTLIFNGTPMIIPRNCPYQSVESCDQFNVVDWVTSSKQRELRLDRI